MERSQYGQTKEALTNHGTTQCPNGRHGCPGYGDLETRRYCCPSPLQPDAYFCCDYYEKHRSDNGYMQRNLPEILIGGVGGLVIVALVLMCLFCRCCYFYKCWHRKRYVEQTAANVSNSSSAARYHSTLTIRTSRWPKSSTSVTPTIQEHTSRRESPMPKYTHRYAYAYPRRDAYESNKQFRNDSSLRPCNSDKALGKYRRGSKRADEDSSFLCPKNRIRSGDEDFEAPPSYAVAHHYPSVPSTNLAPAPAPAGNRLLANGNRSGAARTKK